MKLGEIIEKILKEKGVQYGAGIITGWINEIEGQVIEDIANRSLDYDIKFQLFDYQEDLGRELFIPDRFQDVYMNYVDAKINFINQETERYNNSVVMFNAAYDSYESWFRREHKQKKSYCFSKF